MPYLGQQPCDLFHWDSFSSHNFMSISHICINTFYEDKFFCFLAIPYQNNDAPKHISAVLTAGDIITSCT